MHPWHKVAVSSPPSPKTRQIAQDLSCTAANVKSLTRKALMFLSRSPVSAFSTRSSFSGTRDSRHPLQRNNWDAWACCGHWSGRALRANDPDRNGPLLMLGVWLRCCGRSRHCRHFPRPQNRAVGGYTFCGTIPLFKAMMRLEVPPCVALHARAEFFCGLSDTPQIP